MYGPSDPMLVVGQTYAVRIKAFDPLNKTQFKNNGESEVCVFTYVQGNTQKARLLSPIKAEVSPFNNGHQFKYQTPAGSKSMLTDISIYKLKPNQEPEQAIANNPDLTNKVDAKVGLESYSYPNRLDPGKYCWIIRQYLPGQSPEQGIVSDYEVFTVSDETVSSSDIKSFKFCGFEIFVNGTTSDKPESFSGSGYFFPKAGSSKTSVKFNQLKLLYFGYENGVSTNWQVVDGKMTATLATPENYKVTANDGIDGKFEILIEALRFTVNNLPAYFDSKKKHWILAETEKGSPQQVDAKTVGIWKAPFNASTVYEVTKFVNGKPTVTKSKKTEPFMLKAEGWMTLIDFTKFTFYGNLKSQNPMEGNIDYPELVLTLNAGSEIKINTSKAGLNLSGNIKIPNGYTEQLMGKNIKSKDQYNFEDQNTLLIQTTYVNGKRTLNLCKDKSTRLVIEKANFRLSSNAPDGGCAGFSSLGLFIPYPKLELDYLGKTYSLTADKCVTNFGNGYCLKEKKGILSNFKFEDFKTSENQFYCFITNSRLENLGIVGKLVVPVLQVKMPFEIMVDYDGVQDGYVETDGKEYTMYEKGGDKVTYKPTSGVLKKGNVVLDGKFSFYNAQKENLELKNVELKKLNISSAGEVSHSGFYYFLPTQVKGFYQSYVFKAAAIKVKAKAGQKVEIKISGTLVLEEESISSKNALLITYAFHPNHGVSSEEYQYADAGNLPPVPSDNSLEISTNKVRAAHEGPLGTFEIEVEYKKDDPVYGNGFIGKGNAELSEPYDIDVSVYLCVGKKIKIGSSFNYWFIESGVSNFKPIPTGILDVSVYGFKGRVYYHMEHAPGSTNINNNDYIPSSNVKLGVFALADLKTAGSDGRVFWGPLSTEVTTNANWGLDKIKCRGEAQLLSSGAGSLDGKLSGYADLTMAFSPKKYFQGLVHVEGVVYDAIQLSGDLNLYFGSDDFYVRVGSKQVPISAYFIPTGNQVSAYVCLEKKSGNIVTSFGAAGDVFSIGVNKKKCIGCCDVVECCFKASAQVRVYGSIDGSVAFPNFQMQGGVALDASAEVCASACGIGMCPGVSCSVSGQFALPDPFCVGGTFKLVTPSPLPDIGFRARYHSDAGVQFGVGNCY